MLVIHCSQVSALVSLYVSQEEIEDASDVFQSAIAWYKENQVSIQCVFETFAIFSNSFNAVLFIISGWVLEWISQHIYLPFFSIIGEKNLSFQSFQILTIFCWILAWGVGLHTWLIHGNLQVLSAKMLLICKTKGLGVWGKVILYKIWPKFLQGANWDNNFQLDDFTTAWVYDFQTNSVTLNVAPLVRKQVPTPWGSIMQCTWLTFSLYTTPKLTLGRTGELIYRVSVDIPDKGVNIISLYFLPAWLWGAFVTDQS